MDELLRKTYIEIDNRVLTHNAEVLTRAYPHKYYIAVVKGNAYGHGYGIIPALIKGGINAFAVSNLYEALKVREYDKEHPVIMLEPVHAEAYPLCAENDISVCINERATLDEAIQSGCELKVHIKVDCGMNRLGFKDKDGLNIAFKAASEASNITVEGIFSHFHTTGIADTEYEADLERFKKLTEDLDLSKIPMVHIDKSQTIMAHEKVSFSNAVRFGIVLYGFNLMIKYPNDVKGQLRKLKAGLKNFKNRVKPCLPYPELDIKTALTLYSEVIQVKKVAAGEYCGYGLVHKAESDEYIAVIDTGYGDGINRKRVGTFVSINGNKYPIVAEIGMGMSEVKVDESVKRHDRVCVFGGEIPIRSVLRHVHTTMYEMMTNLDSSIPRIYKNSDT